MTGLPTQPGRFRDADRGSGSVLVLGICGVLLSMLAASALLGSAIATRHRAQAAADLAALAAADVALGRRPGDPCRLAAAVAAANGAGLVACEVTEDSGAVVRVEIAPPGPAAAIGVAQVSARAGPAP